jgi:hypothetical protein
MHQRSKSIVRMDHKKTKAHHKNMLEKDALQEA